jgi:uncharacterized membrane protein YphA (DoxX/SURF4 family)
LRVVVGFTLLIQGAGYLSDRVGLQFDRAAAVALALSGGLCFLAGILTPLTSLVVVLATIGYALSWIPAPTANLLDSKLVILYVLTTATATLFLGPGAFSLDARLFGRRELFIPSTTRSPKS